MNIKKCAVIILLLLANGWNMQSENRLDDVQDTLVLKSLHEVVIISSTKETNHLKTLPGSVSFITPSIIEDRKLSNIKDLSTVIPNFFIPDYGSKLSVPVYIRGIGERSTGQSIGMYVDHAPLLDKSAFDFEFMDIRRIEVLRGPQGTLYGRNAMSGLVRLTTLSPLQDQRIKVLLSAGNFGLFKAKASVSELLTDNIGLAVNGYYHRNDGYFTNRFSGEKADPLQSGGGSIRLDWKLNPYWTAQLSANYDHVDQGAFPYGLYTADAIADPNYNSPGNYTRELAGSNFNLNYTNDAFIFNSNTGFQYLDDNMKMDIDNSPLAVFRLNQLQNEKSWTEELTIKSNTKSNYQWSFGLFGFYTDLKTNVITTMDTDGIRTILQPAFDKIHENNPRAPLMTIKNTDIPIPGTFKTPTYGGAVFHQSTYNNLFVDGLSLTAGVRLDYEKSKLDYNTNMNMDLSVDMQAGQNLIHLQDSALTTVLQGNLSTRFMEILPKIALKYEFTPENYIYATVSNGYKAGGYNIQNFADIVQDAVRAKYDRTFHTSPVDSLVSYKPESGWNYELGFKGEILKDVLSTEVAVYYTDVNDIQITDFVASGQGRILKNAGKAQSVGFEVSFNAALSNELGLSLNYGFTRATFIDYKTGDEADATDYSGNYVPFAPQNTFSLNGIYNKKLQNSRMIDRFHISGQYNGAGRIYWTEANDVYQDFYGLLNLRAGANKGCIGINFWANNLLNTHYAAFYFESMGQRLAQAGKPFTFGIDINLTF
ncbi:TonB-dependent receptor [Bacteroidia bacterium]|nr:TonB-dependent receptor [Bacteroidia bacterium]